MASAKAVDVVISSNSSEVAKDKVIVAAVAGGMSAGSANIVRDANGKVTAVRLVFPDTVAQSAIDAIAAVPGAVNVVTTDVPLGFQGTDGTQATVNALVADGWSLDETTAQDTAVSTVYDATNGTFKPTFGAGVDGDSFGFWSLGKGSTSRSNPLFAIGPLASEIEFRMKFASTTDPNLNTDITIVNGGYIYGMAGNFTTGLRSSGGATFSLLNPLDNAFHTYKFEAITNHANYRVPATLADICEVFVDTVSKGIISAPFRGFALDQTALTIRFNAQGASAAHEHEIDYVRWTQPV